MGNQTNLILAVVLSLAVLFGFHHFYDKPRIEALRQAQLQQQNETAAKAALPVAPVAADAKQQRTEIIAGGFAAGERVKINTPRLHGSLNLRGARLDDLTLADYRVSVDKNSAEVVLLAPSGTADPDHAYYAEFGWLGNNVATPTASTLWRSTAKELSPESPVVLTHDNGAGLVFTRTISVDANYMFTIKDEVRNTGSAALTLYPFGLLSRHATPPLKDMFILHEGPLGVFNGTLEEVKYHTLKEDGAVDLASSKGGWLGMTDKYWLAALVPDQSQPMFARMMATDGPHDRYQVDLRGAEQQVAAGASIASTTRLFAGAKEVRLLDAYEQDLGIVNFDLAVDFGWFYFLTKPFFLGIDFIAAQFKHTGYGFAIAILIFTVLLKLLFFPLQNKSYIAMNKLRVLHPKVMELRERWAHDKQRMNMEVFEMYRKERANPMAGCWPILVQIPVFFALYKVLFVTIEMRHAPFPGWVPDLSAADPTSIFNLFGLLPWALPAFLMIGVWPILMGVTMYLQQKLSPPPADPIQATVFKWLPLFFTVLLAHFPAGLVIYWTWSNLLSILQQWVLLKRHHPDKQKA